MTKEEIVKKLKGGLVVSCQALPEEPLYREEGGVMVLMAKAALENGALGIRAQGVVDVKQIREFTDEPLIGIIKINYEGYKQYITPTMKEVDALVEAGADIIALDATDQTRGDGLTSYEYIKAIKEKYPNQLLMADISTLEEGIASAEAGIDFIGTTMSGYTDYTEQTEDPDYQLIKDLTEHTNVPIIAEGRFRTPEHAKKALELGAFCVTIGGAITRPQEIVQRFVRELG